MGKRKYIDSDNLKKFEESLADVIVSSQGFCSYEDCKKRAKEEAPILVATLISEEPEPSDDLIDRSDVRDDFVAEVYRVLDADPTNDRANAIIDAFDTLPAIQPERQEVDLEKITNVARIKELPDGFDKEWLTFYHTDKEYNSAKFFHLSLTEREYIIARHFYEQSINIETKKLTDEINRRIKSWSIREQNEPKGQGRDTCTSRITELKDLLSSIIALQQEPSHLADASKMERTDVD